MECIFYDMVINVLTGNQSSAAVAPEANSEPEATEEEASVQPVTDGPIYGNQEPVDKPVRVSELESYIAENKRKKGFEEEFMVSSYQSWLIMVYFSCCCVYIVMRVKQVYKD